VKAHVIVLFMTLMALTARAETCAPASVGLSQCQFDEVAAKIERIYSPVFARLGGELWLRAKWNSESDNAKANEFGRFWLVNLYGGLARRAGMTRDAFALVACHEVGHHLGGSPRLFLSAMASEGEADYFATLKCARTFFGDEDNAAALQGIRTDSYLISECKRSFADLKSRLICVRSGVAAKTLVEVLQDINKDASLISFRTPDQSHASVFAVLDRYVFKRRSVRGSSRRRALDGFVRDRQL
jgi:hypothetical protein